MLLILTLACAGGDAEPPADTAPDIPRAPLQLSLPLAEPDRFDGRLGVDHDPEVYSGVEQLYCLDYDERTWPWCYDEHDGTDYLLEGSWEAMDAGSTAVIAAADGVVIDAEDGNYDRCHGDIATFDVSCDGHPIAANYVILEHEGGWRTLYWHLMEGSVAVSVGDEVTCGQDLGLVGSSGNSSQPHLHFELQSADGEAIDPYAGPLSQPETWWIEQGDPEGMPALTCGGSVGSG